MNEDNDGGGEQFSLRWNNFQANVTSGFESLLEGEELVDVTIAAGGRLLRVHKLVLSICSPYFKEIFKTNPCQHPIVIIKDIGYREMEGLVQFMYRGEVSIAQEHLPDFLRAAELLSIKGLAANDSENSKSIKKSSKLDAVKRTSWAPPSKKKRSACIGESQEVMTAALSDDKPSTGHLQQALGGLTPKEEPVDELDATAESDPLAFVQPLLKTNSRSGAWNFPSDNSDSQGSRSAAWNSSADNWELQGGGGFQMTSRGRLQLVRNGYVYHCNRQTEDKIFWKCAEYNRTRCRSRCISVGGVVTVTHANHNHVAAMSQPRLQQPQVPLQPPQPPPDNT